MMKKRTTHGYFLESSRLLFQNAKDDEEINALLLPFKVDEQKYEHGLSLCTQGYKLDSNQIKLHGQQYRARKKFEKLQSEANEVDAAYRTHKIKLGAAQDAVVQRDDVFKELAIFRKKFVAICRTALKDHPQLLEKLGIKAYSEGYVRAKPKKDEEQPPADGGSTQTAANAGVVENEGSPVELAAVQTAPDNNKKKKRK